MFYSAQGNSKIVKTWFIRTAFLAMAVFSMTGCAKKSSNQQSQAAAEEAAAATEEGILDSQSVESNADSTTQSADTQSPTAEKGAADPGVRGACYEGYQDRLVSSLATRDCSPDTPFSGDGDCQQANYLASQGAGTGAEVGAGCRAREVVSRDACTYQNFGLYPFRTGRWTCSARLWMSCPC